VVARDAQEPGGEGLRRVVGGHGAVGPDEGLLGGVPRLLVIAEQPDAEPEHGPLVQVDEPSEGDLVPLGRGAGERRVGAWRWGQARLRLLGEGEN